MARDSFTHTLLRLALRWLTVLALGGLCGLWGLPGAAMAQGANPKFDHVKTGFPLSGAHTSTRCESCHINGVFKGTPRDCQTCHTTGSRFSRANATMPGKHIPVSVQQTCDSCHGTQAFTGVRFSHSTMVSGARCQTCHDGVRSQGKPATHIPTRAACETCHTTNTWSSARPDHSGFNASTNCASCHNGSAASGKSGNHIPTSGSCSSCHSTSTWKPSTWNHSQQSVAGQCASCHTGTYAGADGKPQNHIPYAALSGVAIANCDTCHKGGFSSWNPGRFHASVSIVGQCATCHLTPVYGLTAKPSTTVHAGVSGGCEACHNTSGWAGARVDHSKFNTTTQCSSCHNGSAATGKPGNHIPVTANCISCHSTQTWKPSSWNHTQVVVANQCSSCHSGAYPPADGRPGNHIPYTALSGVAIANCDSCHKGGFSRWNPGRFHASVSIVGQCATCHLTPVYGLTSKPANALHASVTGGCEACHNTSGWSGARVDHSKFNTTTQCASCHNGSTATGKPGNHIPTAANCISCHTTSTFSTGKFHGNVPFTTACATCHNGAYVGPDNKPSNHIPYQSVSATATAGCDTCHKGGFTTWANGRLHTNVTVTTQCKTCHMGNYLGSIGKPNNHIPESQLLNGTLMECNACHKSTAAGGFGTAVMDHNNSQGNGSGWCYACHRSGTAFLGNMDRKSLTHQKSSGVTDCSQSGCHRPLGTRGTTYRSWD